MAVRFLPAPSEEPAASKPDRKNLAEVIELRSLLRQREWKEAAAERAVPEAETATDVVADEARDVAVSDLALSDLAVPDLEVPDLAAPELDVPELDVSEQAVKLLARKAKSSGELREELLRLGYRDGEVEAVIEEFEQNLYLDDAGLARAVAEKLRDTKRASRSQIRVKLKARRLPDGAIEAALSELDDEDEFALLRATAEERVRRLQGLDRATAERRLLGFLARRGWSGEPATRAVREALNSAGNGRSSGGATGGSAAGGVRFR